MTLEEKIAMANQVRSRDRFGSVSPEEQAALPGTETELWIKTQTAVRSMSLRNARTPCPQKRHYC